MIMKHNSSILQIVIYSLLYAVSQTYGGLQYALSPELVLSDLKSHLNSQTEAAPQGLELLTTVPSKDSQSASAACSSLGLHLCSIEDTLASWIVDGVDYGYELFFSHPEVKWAFTSTFNNQTGLPYLVDSQVTELGVAPSFRINVQNPPAFPLCCGKFVPRGYSSTGGSGNGGSTDQTPWVPNPPPPRPIRIEDSPGPSPPPQQDHCVLTPVMWTALYNSVLFDIRNSSISPSSMLPLADDPTSQQLANTDWLMLWDDSAGSNGLATPVPGSIGQQAAVGAGSPDGGLVTSDGSDGGGGGIIVASGSTPTQTSGDLLQFIELHGRHLLSTRSEHKSFHLNGEQLTDSDTTFYDEFNYQYSPDVDIQFYNMYTVQKGYVWVDKNRMCARLISPTANTASVLNNLVFEGSTTVTFALQFQDITQAGLFLSFQPLVSTDSFQIGCDASTSGQCNVESGFLDQAAVLDGPISFPVSTTDVWQVRVILRLDTTPPRVDISYTIAQKQSLASSRSLTAGEVSNFVLADGTFLPYQIGFSFVGTGATPNPLTSKETCVSELEIDCVGSMNCNSHCLPGYAYYPDKGSMDGLHPQDVCVPCAAGSYSANGTTCVECSVGTYSAAGAANCIACPSALTPGATLCPAVAAKTVFGTFPWSSSEVASSVSGISMNGDTNFMFFVFNTNDEPPATQISTGPSQPALALSQFLEMQSSSSSSSSSTRARAAHSHSHSHADASGDEASLSEAQKRSNLLARNARLARRQHQHQHQEDKQQHHARTRSHAHAHAHADAHDVLSVNANGVVVGLTERDSASVSVASAFDPAQIAFGFILRDGLVGIVENGALVQPYIILDATSATAFRIERKGVTINYYMGSSKATSQLLKIYSSHQAARSCRYWAAVSFEGSAAMFNGFGYGFHTPAGDRGDDAAAAAAAAAAGTLLELRTDTHANARARARQLSQVQTPILGAHFYKDACPSDSALSLTCDDTYMSNDVLYWTTSFCSAMVVQCPSGCNNTITGTGQYTGDSHICTAAIHALGQDGGQVVFSPMGSSDNFIGSWQHDIQSEEWLRKFPVTYRVADTDSSWDTGGYCGQVDPPENAIPRDSLGELLACQWRNNYHTCAFKCREGYSAPPTTGVGMMCLNGQWQQPYASCQLDDPSGLVGCFFSELSLLYDPSVLNVYTNDFYSVGPGHSIESCWLQALAHNYTHFGMKGTDECFIGNEYGQYGNNTKGCMSGCTAFPQEVCGDAVSWRVFDTRVYLPPARSPVKRYLGCFAETSSMEFIGPGFTEWSCAYRGLLRGYNTTTYFGLFNGTDCYLGVGLYTDLSPVAESQCNLPCRAYPYPHYPQFKCGGTQALSIYAIVSFIRILDIDHTNDFNYDAAPNGLNVWTDTSTAFNWGLNIKHQEFNTIPFSVIRLCVNDTLKCIVYQHNKVFDNAVDLFTSGYIPMDQEDTTNFAQIWPISACTAVAPGFNVLCPGTSQYPGPHNTRWGYCRNHTEVCSGGSSLIAGGPDSPVVLAEQGSSSSSSGSRRSAVTSIADGTSEWASVFPAARLADLSHNSDRSSLPFAFPRARDVSTPSSSRHLLSVDTKIEAMKRKRLHKQTSSPSVSSASPISTQSVATLLETSSSLGVQQQLAVSYDVYSVDSVLGIGLDVGSDESESFGAGYSSSFRANNQASKPTPPFAAYLDVIQEEDWTLVMEIGADGFFNYDSPYWQNTDVYPHGQDGTMQDAHGNAKYDSFHSLKFSQMRLCVGFRDTNCVHASFSQTYNSVNELFSSPERVPEGVSQQEFNTVFDPWATPACSPVFFGVNVQCPVFLDSGKQQLSLLGLDSGETQSPPSNTAVRWGYCAQRPAADIDCSLDSTNADAVIGMGLRALYTGPDLLSDCCSAGAGYTNMFVYDKPNPLEPLSDAQVDLDDFPQFHRGNFTGHESAERAWLYIRPISPFPGMY